MDGSRTSALNPVALQLRPLQPTAAGAFCIAPAPPVLMRRISLNLAPGHGHTGRGQTTPNPPGVVFSGTTASRVPHAWPPHPAVLMNSLRSGPSRLYVPAAPIPILFIPLSFLAVPRGSATWICDRFIPYSLDIAWRRRRLPLAREKRLQGQFEQASSRCCFDPSQGHVRPFDPTGGHRPWCGRDGRGCR